MFHRACHNNYQAKKFLWKQFATTQWKAKAKRMLQQCLENVAIKKETGFCFDQYAERIVCLATIMSRPRFLITLLVKRSFFSINIPQQFPQSSKHWKELFGRYGFILSFGNPVSRTSSFWHSCVYLKQKSFQTKKSRQSSTEKFREYHIFQESKNKDPSQA